MYMACVCFVLFSESSHDLLSLTVVPSTIHQPWPLGKNSPPIDLGFKICLVVCRETNHSVSNGSPNEEMERFVV